MVESEKIKFKATQANHYILFIFLDMQQMRKLILISMKTIVALNKESAKIKMPLVIKYMHLLISAIPSVSLLEGF